MAVAAVLAVSDGAAKEGDFADEIKHNIDYDELASMIAARYKSKQ